MNNILKIFYTMFKPTITIPKWKEFSYTLLNITSWLQPQPQYATIRTLQLIKNKHGLEIK